MPVDSAVGGEDRPGDRKGGSRLPPFFPRAGFLERGAENHLIKATPLNLLGNWGPGVKENCPKSQSKDSKMAPGSHLNKTAL